MSIRRHIPNIVTSMNLLCGAVGVTFALADRPAAALVCMLAAGVCDFLDGFVARALGASSAIGKELDSLCDCVSFGLLPALMLHRAVITAAGGASAAGVAGVGAGAGVAGAGIAGLWVYVPLLLAAFSAYRLAKFNLDERQSGSFIGLPTPPCALICASLCALIGTQPDSALAHLCAPCWVLPLLSLILSFLLVSEIPMFAFKFGHGTAIDRSTLIQRWAFVGIALVSVILTIILHWAWPAVILMTFAGYLLINLVAFALSLPPFRGAWS